MVVQSRVTGLSFNQIPEDEIRFCTDQIMFNCAAVSGCPLPNTEGFAEIISKNLVNFILNFGYEMLTLEEILLAVSVNDTPEQVQKLGIEFSKVVFSGNCFHVSYMAEILKNYMNLRNLLDRKFQNHIDGYSDLNRF